MLLGVKARIVLLHLLPVESNWATWKTINKLKEALYFSEEETKALDFKDVPLDPPVEGQTQTQWNTEADKEIEVKIGELATLVIAARLDSMPAETWTSDIWWLVLLLVDGKVDVSASIVKALKSLDEKDKLRPEHLPLYERFVEGKE